MDSLNYRPLVGTNIGLLPYDRKAESINTVLKDFVEMIEK